MNNITKNYIILFISSFLLLNHIVAQDADLLLYDESYQLIDRIDIKKQFGKSIYTQTKPLARTPVKNILDSTIFNANLKPKEKKIYQFLSINTSSSLPKENTGFIRRYIYSNRRDFISYKNQYIKLYLNPLLYASSGYQKYTPTTLNSETGIIYRNTRGVSLRGSLLDKIGFYSEITDNQVIFPTYTSNRINLEKVIRGEAFWKRFGDNGVDYLHAKGYITYQPFRFLRFKIGKDRQFWGNGFESLWLSDVATDYWLGQFQLNFDKFQYHYTLNQMIDHIPGKPDVYGSYPRKYGVFQQVTYAPSSVFHLFLFESVVYASSDPGKNRGFELQYLNPLILFRSIEQYIGSPDNALLGLGFKSNLFKSIQLYGQFLLDDINIQEFKNNPNYWGNKFGYQIGLKWIDVLNVPFLNLQTEYNRIRPYTYAHFNTSSNYSNYGQNLAHSEGANLFDWNINASYLISPKWRAYFRYRLLHKGLDLNSKNYGGDLYRSNTTHDNERSNVNYDNLVTQGNLQKSHAIYFSITYRPFKTLLYIDLVGNYQSFNYQYEIKPNVIDEKNSYFSISFRYFMTMKKPFSF